LASRVERTRASGLLDCVVRRREPLYGLFGGGAHDHRRDRVRMVWGL